MQVATIQNKQKSIMIKRVLNHHPIQINAIYLYELYQILGLANTGLKHQPYDWAEIYKQLEYTMQSIYATH